MKVSIHMECKDNVSARKVIEKSEENQNIENMSNSRNEMEGARQNK